MLIKGEKYACDACVRGHRVSNCNHYERPLTHINRKGRPVSQCPHCRGLRKARASHVKCECGNKGKGDGNKCCCSAGQRCVCALKKDHLNTVLESGVGSLKRSRSSTDPRKHRSNDCNLTQFANGHHAPVHRRNNTRAERGRPYPLGRPHSIHGNHSWAQTSSDSLPLVTTPEFSSFDFFPDKRTVRSEHGSPGMLPASIPRSSDLTYLDLSYNSMPLPDVTPSSLPGNLSAFNAFDNGYMSSSTAGDVLQFPPVGASIGEPVDWAALGLSNNTLAADYPPAPSYASLEQGQISHPGMTTASSVGEPSDNDDFYPMNSPAPGACSPFPQFEEAHLNNMGPYNMSTESLSGSFGSMTPPPSMANAAAMNTLASRMSTEPFMRGSTPQSPLPFDDYGSNVVGTPIDSGVGSPYSSEISKLTHSTLLDGRGPSPPMAMGRPMPTSDPSWNAPNSFPEDEIRLTPGMHEPVWAT